MCVWIERENESQTRLLVGVSLVVRRLDTTLKGMCSGSGTLPAIPTEVFEFGLTGSVCPRKVSRKRPGKTYRGSRRRYPRQRKYYAHGHSQDRTWKAG